MKRYILLLITLVSFQMKAQSETEAIKATLQTYLDGSSYNDPEKIVSAFYEEADLFLHKEDEELFIMTPAEYAALFAKREKGTFNGREGTILNVDYDLDIATAKVEIYIPKPNLRFVDIFLLKKLNGKWKIISKAATLLKD
nr:nuclear transport factor 2 family protein [Allomuricauda sp.]